jgi:ABC-type bacteriocin/lantibiotic exporter with double-glycine peptidase domain
LTGRESTRRRRNARPAQPRPPDDLTWFRKLTKRGAPLWLSRPAKLTLPTQPDSEQPGPEMPPCAGLARAFEQLCRELGRPFPAAEIRAAAPPGDQGMTLPNLLLAAERLGFKTGEFKPDPKNLARMPTPFLIVGARPGEGWLVRARIADHLVLSDPGAGGTSALHVETVADLAQRLIVLKPLAETVQRRQWRDSIMRRLRPVLWELGIASVVINLLALATPIFLMTVYNTDERYPAAC